MAEAASGIIPATSYGDREPPGPRSKPKEKARVSGAAATAALAAPGTAEFAADEVEKHELDTMA